MKQILFFFTLFFLFLGSLFHLHLLHGSGTEGEISRLQIEIFGGLSMLNPADLNQRPEYDNSYERYFSEDRYSYYHSLVGDFFTYSGQIEGRFKKIKHALPLGFRLKYCLNPAISVSLSFKYLSKSQDSRVIHQYDVCSINPDGVFFYNEFSSTRENAPYTISAKGYAPLIGIHYKILRNQSINFESYVSVGPLFAKCGFARQRRYRETNSYGYWYERNLIYEIEGKSTGIVLDAGLRMNIRLFKNIDLFVEGGYSYQRAANVVGYGSSETVYTDLNSSGYTESSTWVGTWAIIPGSFDREWGELPYQFPSNEYGSDALPDFNIDLSGFQLRIGIAFKL